MVAGSLHLCRSVRPMGGSACRHVPWRPQTALFISSPRLSHRALGMKGGIEPIWVARQPDVLSRCSETRLPPVSESLKRIHSRMLPLTGRPRKPRTDGACQPERPARIREGSPFLRALIIGPATFDQKRCTALSVGGAHPTKTAFLPIDCFSPRMREQREFLLCPDRL